MIVIYLAKGGAIFPQSQSPAAMQMRGEGFEKNMKLGVNIIVDMPGTPWVRMYPNHYMEVELSNFRVCEECLEANP